MSEHHQASVWKLPWIQALAVPAVSLLKVLVQQTEAHSSLQLYHQNLAVMLLWQGLK